jgi:hypothetical protein
VLYLGEPGELELDADVRLHETGPNERGQYLALSHCWGKLQPIKTERANLNTHRNTIPWKALTHTFQDAIKFTRQMRIRYLWIDSLCIIQDDEDDRLYEAAQMAGVYQNAYLTIAATAGPDGNFGLFRSPGGPRGCTELELPAKPTDKRSHRREERLFLRRRLPHDAFWTFTPDGPPLLTRAWVFQERLLSARVVHFAHDELVWECGERYACECGEAQARNSGKATAKQGDFRGRAGAQWMAKDDYLERQKKWEKREKGEGGGDGETSPQKERRTRMEFRAFVSTYSHLRLTRETDRLPAFAGIAKWFRDGGQGGSSGDDSGDSDDGERGAYWAGLWQGSLASDLAWQVREPTVPLSARPRVPRTGEPGYVGPTWSWVSAREPFYNLQLVNQDSPPAFTVLDAEFAWRGPDRFGPIASGSLVLSGFVRDVRLQTWRRLSSTRRPMREDDLDMSPNEDVKVGIADEKGDLDVVRLDFAPDWGELGDRAGTGRAPARHRRREWELIGECPDTCQLFYLTARSALLLMREVPGTSVYRRIGVFFEFDEAKLGQRTTLRIV